jgi:hypothetical protein
MGCECGVPRRGAAVPTNARVIGEVSGRRGRRALLLLSALCLVATQAAAQNVLFDFDSTSRGTPLPLTLTVGGVTASLSATGQGFSIQAANTLGFTPAGFSGNCIYPSSVFPSDLQVSFSPPITDISILFSPSELACDTTATMRITGYSGAVSVATSTATAPQPGTYPTGSLILSAAQGFDRVVIHYAAAPALCDSAPIFLADNMNVTPLATAQCATDRDCSDHDACNGVEQCNAHGVCVPGTPLSCDDRNACTTDSCDPATGCVNAPVVCADQNACTVDTCDPATGCVYLPVSCDDQNACTTDTCVPATGCVYAPLSCDDHNGCTTDSCVPATGCVHVPVSCDDHDGCTTDACDPATGCTHVPQTCDDQNACTTDTCDPVTGCSHAAVACDDGNACTDDACDPQSGCVHTNNKAPCDDGNDCTGTAGHPDACQAGKCAPGPYNLDECAICRTADFWGRRGGTSYDKKGRVTGFNYTQAVIDANGGHCLQVCGQSICGTDAVAPDKGGLGTLGSALEALCITGKDKRQADVESRQVRPDCGEEPRPGPLHLNEAYREMVTAALNCVVSGAGDDCGMLFDQVLVGVTWDQCNRNCAAPAPNRELLETCLSQLECWNGGDDVRRTGHGWGCVPHCKHHRGSDCNNCEDRGLCESRSEDVITEITDGNPFLTCDRGQCESLGPPGGVEACKSAEHKPNNCTIGNPGDCEANLCDVCTHMP